MPPPNIKTASYNERLKWPYDCGFDLNPTTYKDSSDYRGMNSSQKGRYSKAVRAYQVKKSPMDVDEEDPTHEDDPRTNVFAQLARLRASNPNTATPPPPSATTGSTRNTTPAADVWQSGSIWTHDKDEFTAALNEQEMRKWRDDQEREDARQDDSFTGELNPMDESQRMGGDVEGDEERQGDFTGDPEVMDESQGTGRDVESDEETPEDLTGELQAMDESQGMGRDAQGDEETPEDFTGELQAMDEDKEQDSEDEDEDEGDGGDPFAGPSRRPVARGRGRSVTQSFRPTNRTSLLPSRGGLTGMDAMPRLASEAKKRGQSSS